MSQVAALFVRSDTVYRSLGADCWDVERNAVCYAGPGPVVAHPPCRAWGRLRKLAKPRPDEKDLAVFAVECVRRFGGVLEHPYGSTLWPYCGLPGPKAPPDEFGGFTVVVDQGWWGHAAPKPTYLYIVGMTRGQLEEFPVQLLRAAGRTLLLCPADRERTPVEFARFLLRTAGACSVTSTAVCQLPRSGTVLLPRPGARAVSKRANFRAFAASL